MRNQHIRGPLAARRHLAIPAGRTIDGILKERQCVQFVLVGRSGERKIEFGLFA